MEGWPGEQLERGEESREGKRKEAGKDVILGASASSWPCNVHHHRGCSTQGPGPWNPYINQFPTAGHQG